MRKAAWQANEANLPWQLRVDAPTFQTYSMVIQAEAERVDKVLTMAQRVGLPPPFTHDLVAMWYEPVVTLNHPVSAIEMDDIPSPVDRPSKHLGYGRRDHGLEDRAIQSVEVAETPVRSDFCRVRYSGQSTLGQWNADREVTIQAGSWMDEGDYDEP